MENMFQPNELREYSIKPNFSQKIYVYFILIFSLLFFLLYFLFFNAPTDFPKGVIFNIGPGENLRSISLKLKDDNLIRSRLVFEAFTIIYGGERHIIATDYFFENKLSVFELARRISKGERHLAPIKVTIPEGFNVSEIAEVFVLKLSNFSKEKFLLNTKNLEGYLFPDTYFFLTTSSTDDILKSINDNYEKKVSPLRPEIIKISKTEKEIIIMASIIEKEAKGDFDRGFISGILWKRIKIGMPLQVDADLSTYKTKGLPQNPIANPGLSSILASIHPQNSPYLYYLHDKDGNIHYARNFTEHLQNKLKYLSR